MKGHKIHFYGEIWEIIRILSLLPLLIWTTEMGASPFFLPYFPSNFLFVSLGIKALPKWDQVLKERICSYGSRFFQELIPNEEGLNESTACRCKPLAVAAFRKFYVEKGALLCQKKIGGLPPLLVWVPLLIVNNYSEFQVNIFSNYRDIRKCQSFHTTPQPLMTPGL